MSVRFSAVGVKLISTIESGNILKTNNIHRKVFITCSTIVKEL